MPPSIPEPPSCTVFSIVEPMPYAEALLWQYELVRQRQEGTAGDTLLILEHSPVITLGRRESGANLLSSPNELWAQGIDVQAVDRGGEVTYHAPGQMVGYPILDLRNHGQDLHRYLRDLEQVIIDTLARFGLAGERESGLTGVWVGGRKIAALGIKVSRWVSMHGFALNVDVDLGPMRRDIVPCGLHGRDVCSLAELLPSRHVTRSDVEPILVQTFAEVFRIQVVPGV